MQIDKWIKSSAASVALLMVAASPTIALAQQAKATASEQNAAELSGTARLNQEQAAKAKAEEDAYQARVSVVVATDERNDALFENATATYENRKAAVAQRAATERLQWEADVRACEAGDTTRCGTTEPQED